LARDKNTFRFLVRLGTEPKVYYHSTQPWVRQLAETKLARMKKETVNG
jgi:hypothetical protein